MNRSGTEYMCVQSGRIFDGPSDDASLAAIASWHANAIRVPLNEDCWLGVAGEPVGGLTSAQYQTAIENYVARAHQHGLYVILDLHWSAPGAFQATRQEGMADADHSTAMWASVGRAFGHDPATVFDLFNEPTGISWLCWRDGCRHRGDPTNGRGEWPTAGMQSLVAAVRGAGAKNVILLGGLSFANDLSSWLRYEPADPAHQLAASFHVYNFNLCNTPTCWDDQVSPVSARVPIVMGEIGQQSCAGDFIDTTMRWADVRDISYLAWVWDTWGGCGSILIADYAGAPTPGYGSTYQSHLADRSAETAAAGATRANPVAPRANPVLVVASLLALGLIGGGIWVVRARRRVIRIR